MDDTLGFEHRFTGASVQQVFPQDIFIELRPPVLGHVAARIPAEHLGGCAAYKPGDSIDRVFVYDLRSSHSGAAGTAHHIFASAVWGESARNPWYRAHPQHPAVGQILDLVVHRHATEDWAVCRLQGGLLEMFLSRFEVPDGRFHSLTECLPLGTTLRAKVVRVDTLRCTIHVSVKAWLDDVQRAQGSAPKSLGAPHSQTPLVRLIDANALNALNVASGPAAPSPRTQAQDLPVLTQAWACAGVLLIDDDKAFSRNLARWLRAFGTQVWQADNTTHAASLLKTQGAQISHMLVDYHLGDAQMVKEMVRLVLQQKGKTIALMSGMTDRDTLDGMERLRGLRGAPSHLPLLAKPLRFDELDRWIRLKEPIPGVLEPQEAGAFWTQGATPVHHDIAERASRWLEAVCKHEGAQAGLWVRCHEFDHECISSYGILPRLSTADRRAALEQTLSRMAQTLVGDVQVTRRTRQAVRQASDPLARIWPASAPNALAVPLTTEGLSIEESVRLEPASGTGRKDALHEPVGDVLVLFSEQVIDELKLRQPAWFSLQHWWADLLALERTQLRLVEDATFATQGRVHSATLHEVRPLLQAFRSPKPWSHEEAVAWWGNGKRITHFVDGGLYNIRPERIAHINLRQRVLDLMQDFLWQFAARRYVHLHVYLPPANMEVTLPPEVFEQPLVNLVDNATKACLQRRWALVEVRVLLTPDDPLRPLVLRISDQGQGMTPHERRNLFLPRHTQTGSGGFGMGLYVSLQLARAAGGDLVLVENRRWGGTVFELRLPLLWGSARSANADTTSSAAE